MTRQDSAVQLQYMGRVVLFIAGTAKIMPTANALVAYTVNGGIGGAADGPGTALCKMDKLLQSDWTSIGVHIQLCEACIDDVHGGGCACTQVVVAADAVLGARSPWYWNAGACYEDLRTQQFQLVLGRNIRVVDLEQVEPTACFDITPVQMVPIGPVLAGVLARCKPQIESERAVPSNRARLYCVIIYHSAYAYRT